MTTAAVLLGAGAGSRFGGATPKLLAPWRSGTVAGAAVAAAVGAAGVDEVIVVSGAIDLHAVVEPWHGSAPAVSVVHHPGWRDGVASSLACGLAEARRRGHDAVVVGFVDQPDVPGAVWSDLASRSAPVVVARDLTGRTVAIRMDASTWDDLPTAGDTVEPVGAEAVVVDARVTDVDTPGDLVSAEDLEWIEACLGRTPRAPCTVAARDAAGRPTVIANPPFLDDGTPMPTRFWLIDPDLHRRIGGIESAGGVDEAEADIGLDVLSTVHERHRRERDSMIVPGHTGPRPSGGVGGTRVGLKCLHTHYAWYLAGGDDPVGAWVQDRLDRPRPTEGEPA